MANIINKMPKCRIYMILVDCRGILATHGHYCPFVPPKESGDCGKIVVV